MNSLRENVTSKKGPTSVCPSAIMRCSSAMPPAGKSEGSSERWKASNSAHGTRMLVCRALRAASRGEGGRTGG